MTNGLQLAIFGGMIFGGSVAAMVWRLAPTNPDLSDALDRLSPAYVERRARRAPPGTAERDSGAGPTSHVLGARFWVWKDRVKIGLHSKRERALSLRRIGAGWRRLSMAELWIFTSPGSLSAR